MILLRRLPIRSLLYTMTGVVLLALVVQVAVGVRRWNEDLSFVEQERRGVVFIPPVQAVSFLLAQHRGTANMWLNGDAHAEERLRLLEEQLQQAVAAVEGSCFRFGGEMGAACRLWKGVAEEWNGLAAAYRQMPARDSFAAHSALINRVLLLQTEAADSSKLTLDPVLETYYLMDNMVRTLPTLMESLGQVRGRGSGVAVSKTVSQADRIEMARLAHVARVSLRNLQWGMEKIFSALPELEPRWREEVRALSEAVEQFLGVVDGELVYAGAVRIQGEEYYEQATRVLDRVARLYEPVVATLDGELAARAARLAAERNLSLGGAGLVLVLMALLLGYVIRRINRPLAQAVACCERIGRGDYRTPIEVKYRDELGRVLASADDMQARLAVYVERLRLAAQVFEHSHEAILISDADNAILRVNPAFTTITGYTAEEVVGRNPRLLSSGRQDAAFYASMWASILDTGLWKGEIWNRRKSGEIYPEWLTVSTVRDTEGRITHHIGIFSDITDHKAAQEHMQFLAHYDPLTGLTNRALLRDRLKQALTMAGRRGLRVAIQFIDLDRFKAINDTYGHAHGDLVLQTVAERLRGCVRAEDTVARLGGDEFVIILSDLQDSRDAIHVARKVVDDLSLPMTIQGDVVSVTPSIGIALYPDHGADYETLIANADAAMYAAKGKGRNGYEFFMASMGTGAQPDAARQ